MDLLGLLEIVIIVGLLFALVSAVIQWVPMAAPFKTIAYIVLALIAVLMIFGWIRGVPLNEIRLR